MTSELSPQEKNVSLGTALRRLPALRDSPTSMVHEMERMGHVRRCSKGSTVILSGATTARVGFVLHGVLRVKKAFPDGRQQIVELLNKGDFFGGDLGCGKEFDVEAVDDAKIFIAPANSFEALCEHFPTLQRAVAQNTKERFVRMRQFMVVLAKPKISDRILGFLMLLCSQYCKDMTLCRREGELATVKLPIDRRDLSQLLGTQPESISRGLKTLAATGQILVEMTRKIRIRNFPTQLAAFENIETATETKTRCDPRRQGG